MKKVLLGLSILLSASSSWAINFQHYQFNDSYRYSILDDSLFESFKSDFVFSTSLARVKDPVYVTDTDVTRLYGSFIEYNNVVTLSGSYFVSKDLSLGAQLNYVENKVLGVKRNDLADSSLKMKYNLYRDKEYSLSLNPSLLLPTGNKAMYSTTESLGGELLVVGETRFYGINLLASLGYRHADKNRFGIIDYRYQLLTGFGASYDILPELNLNFEMNRDFTMINDYRQDMGGYFLTMKYKAHDRFSIYAGGGLAGVNEIDRETQTYFIGLKIY